MSRSAWKTGACIHSAIRRIRPDSFRMCTRCFSPAWGVHAADVAQFSPEWGRWRRAECNTSAIGGVMWRYLHLRGSCQPTGIGYAALSPITGGMCALWFAS
jgi:hypothetical protein